MPAINLAHLKIQAVHLADKFGEPEAFALDLKVVLDTYTNRTIRSTQKTQQSILPTYHTPTPVLRQIQSELKPLAETRPAEGLALVDALWKENYLEARVLAAWLLGNISPNEAFASISRLPNWLSQSSDRFVRESLLTDSLVRLRREDPQALFILLEQWLISPGGSYQVWGLQALIPVITDPHFENLPAVFRILRPAILAAGPLTQLELKALLLALDRVSLKETTVYLREILTNDPPAMLLRTMRRMLPAFSTDLQIALRDILHAEGK